MSRCWLFNGYIAKNGYGQAKVGGRVVLTHRAVYEVLVGPIPPGLQLDHLCRNRACYNPAHLEPVTQQENIRRGAGNQHRGKPLCVHGHPLSGDNLYVAPTGQRRCRQCGRMWRLVYQQRSARVRSMREGAL